MAESNAKEKSWNTIRHSIPLDVLNDILMRFIILVPEDARENLIRIFFQIELAHWFYTDFYVGSDPRCKPCNMYEFAAHVFHRIPSLKSEIPRLSEVLDEWKAYKQNVPTYGAIILSEGLTHVLLVQSYYAKASWGFPKGKVNQEEDPAHCAVREVLEETGFDISPYLDPEEYLESNINDQYSRLYIIKNIPLSTEFAPQTRCEIKACNWFPITDLPTNKKDMTPKIKMGVNSNAFFLVFPYIKRLRMICSGYGSKRFRTKNVCGFAESAALSAKSSKTKAVTSGTDGADNSGTIKILKKRNPSTGDSRKPSTKRQLFTEEDKPVEFNAPSWTNFKFDISAILDSIS